MIAGWRPQPHLAEPPQQPRPRFRWRDVPYAVGMSIFAIGIAAALIAAFIHKRPASPIGVGAIPASLSWAAILSVQATRGEAVHSPRLSFQSAATAPQRTADVAAGARRPINESLWIGTPAAAPYSTSTDHRGDSVSS